MDMFYNINTIKNIQDGNQLSQWLTLSLRADDTCQVLSVVVWWTGERTTHGFYGVKQAPVHVVLPRSFSQILGVFVETQVFWRPPVWYYAFWRQEPCVLNDPIVWTRDLCRKHHDSGCCFGAAHCAGNVVVLCVVPVRKLELTSIYGTNITRSVF